MRRVPITRAKPGRTFNESEQEYVRANIKYDPDTGDFWRRIPKANGGQSYHLFTIFDELFLAHRIAWFLMTGELPSGTIDHANRDRRDNRWCNLRLADRSQNGANRTWRKGMNRTGFRGVRQQGKKFSASIMHRGKHIYLGTFDTPEEASAAYLRRGRELFGEYFNAEVTSP